MMVDLDIHLPFCSYIKTNIVLIDTMHNIKGKENINKYSALLLFFIFVPVLAFLFTIIIFAITFL